MAVHGLTLHSLNRWCKKLVYIAQCRICGLLDRQLESLLGELEAFPAKDRSQQAWVAVEGHLSSAAVAQLTRYTDLLCSVTVQMKNVMQGR